VTDGRSRPAGAGRLVSSIGAGCRLLLLLLGVSAPASAQSFQLFPNFDFHMDASLLGSDDPRFSWDANLGGAFDLFGWESGRTTFLANYEVIMGDEFRRFDPNQGNYTLEGSVMQNVGGIEIGGQFHHVSRHLSDRPKRHAIDWNMLGVRLGHSRTRRDLRLDAVVEVRRAVEKSAVDYTWEIQGRTGARYMLNPHVGLVGSGQLRLLGVDGSQNRGRQTGFRGEGGVHLSGRAADVELFLAAERRIDPYQLEAATDTWLSVGFRLLGRDEVP
jgi:hypothetical protein